MRACNVLATLSTVVSCAAAKDAPVVSGNPQGVVWSAFLPKDPFFSEADLVGNVRGNISAVAGPGGKGVKFTVQLQNFPTSGGPFLYHIHENLVWGGNCTSALAHLDPYDRGETPACDADKPETCQVGDLSGKHDKITSDPFLSEYIDLYASINYTNPAFFGNRSIVIHYANKTRLTCANFRSGNVGPNYPISISTHTTSTHAATKTPVAPGTHHKTISGNFTGSHNITNVHSATGVLTRTSTSIVTAPGGLTTTTSNGNGVSASATSTTPSPGAAAGNQISISLLGGVVVIMLLSL
ncbi:superoxide dismutase [Trichoderma evansii]